ncbi:MAG: alpha-hydroxy-acid oxidizing protein [Sphingomonadales bacterium]|nr:alpha-hydroxy-acid oxidizing protein [Sphingomonadales bacterium]
MARLKDCLNIEDLRQAASRRAHKMVFDYIDGGADDERTLVNNSRAFDRYDLAFKVLTGVDHIDPSITLLGERLDVPFLCSPAAGNRLFHTEGERAVAKAAADVGTIYALSTLSSVSLEEIAELTDGPKWFQLYVWKDRALVKEMLDRARAAGYTALVLTVDFPITGNRERDPRNGFTIPPTYGVRQAIDAVRAPFWTRDFLLGPPIRYANLSGDTPAVSLNQFVAEQLHAGFDWKDAEWLLGEWNGNAVIKGVVRPDDARRAVELGFDAISISNHGGRQLDHSPAPIDALPAIADEIGSDAELILDGGVRRGTDILKALALGARAVSFARPYLYGLAAGGYAGASRALQIMADAVRRDMALMGIRSVSEIDASFVRTR